MPAKKSTAKRPSKSASTSKPRAPKNRYVKGKGTYTYDKPGPWGQVGRHIGKLLGNTYGGPAGGELGNKIGGLAHYVGRIFGSGEYRVNQTPKFNSLFAGSANAAQLSFGNVEQGVRIRYKEYIGDVISSSSAGAFKLNKFVVNPSREDTFPWLSRIAINFTQYTMKGCIFEFRSTSGDSLNSTNTQLGSIIMTSSYNVLDKPYENKQEMMNSMAAISGRVSDHLVFGVECDTKLLAQDQLYVEAPASGDRRLSDHSDFYIATSGCQGTSVNLGQLHVIYDVVLHIPSGAATGDEVRSSVWDLDPAECLNSDPVYGAITNSPNYSAKTHNDLDLVLYNTGAGSRTYIAFSPESANKKISVTWSALGSAVNNVFPEALTANGLTVLYSSGTPQTNVNTGITAFTYQTIYQLPGVESWKATDYRTFATTGGTLTPWFSLPAATTYPASLTNVRLVVTEVGGDCFEDVV